MRSDTYGSTQKGKKEAGDLNLLTQTARGTQMGDLLRQFWQPVALSNQVEAGKAKALRVFSENLTLYRGTSGQPHLVAGQCAHRVEGEEIRCVYHGWKYDGTGQCVEMPAMQAGKPTKQRVRLNETIELQSMERLEAVRG